MKRASAPIKPYDQQLLAHLARYKRDRLGVSENGMWSRNNKAYGHILPAALRALNILEPVRAEFFDYLRIHPLQLHLHFAHLNSSQALAFNLFFPWLGDRRYKAEPLLTALRLAGAQVAKWQFEEVLDSKERTHFDVTITFERGPRCLIEVKLSEGGFGTGSMNAAKRAKLKSIYRNSLSGKVEDSVLDNERTLFGNYQVLRNLSYLDANTMIMFLLPRANSALADHLQPFLDRTLLPPFRDNVRVVYLEQLIQDLISSPDCRTGIHAQLLADKYIV